MQKDLNYRIFAVVSALDKSGEKAYTTMIQKMVYLTLARHNKEDRWFKPYLYGPFSEQVACSLQLMVGPYLNLESKPEGKLYRPVQDVELEPEVSLRIDIIEREVRQFIDDMKLLGDPSLLTSEGIMKLAKVHWLKKNYASSDAGFLRARALMMAWHLTIEDIKRNLKYLEELRL